MPGEFSQAIPFPFHAVTLHRLQFPCYLVSCRISFNFQLHTFLFRSPYSAAQYFVSAHLLYLLCLSINTLFSLLPTCSSTYLPSTYHSNLPPSPSPLFPTSFQCPAFPHFSQPLLALHQCFP